MLFNVFMKEGELTLHRSSASDAADRLGPVGPSRCRAVEQSCRWDWVGPADAADETEKKKHTKAQGGLRVGEFMGELTELTV